MKTIITIILACATFAYADTPLTITILTVDEPRVFEAYGSILNLKDAVGNPRPATTTEVEAAISQWTAGQTSDYEKRKNMAQFSPPPLQFNGTPIPAGSPIPGKATVKASPTAKPRKK